MLWLLSFDDDKNTLADAVDKYCIGVPPLQWLAWIPQLLTCLVGSEGKLLLNLISQVGTASPLWSQKKAFSFHILLSKRENVHAQSFETESDGGQVYTVSVAYKAQVTAARAAGK